MNKTEYARMAEYESTYWWHLGRLIIINSYLTRAARGRKDLKILNVGCGTGGTLPLLETYGTVDNVDTSSEALKFMRENGYNRLTLVDGIELPFKDGQYDIVVGFDVLEHIEDDKGALREWKRVLKPDGNIVLTVPAYQWLWSAHDVSLHHKRRYTRTSLRRVANEAGLRPAKLSYAIVFSLMLVVGFRLIHSLLGRKTTSETSYVKVPKFVNRLFTWLLGVEARAHTLVNFPFGTSVIALLEGEGSHEASHAR